MTQRRDWAAIRAQVPITLALLVVAAVWGVGAWWSFTEQAAFAAAKNFADPALLPLVIDGFAIATACVAYVASLDGRPAVPARLGTLTAVTISAGSNGWWAAERSLLDPATILMGVIVPIIANIAFEVLLVELRKTVQRARGLPAPVAIPTLRIVRLILAPIDTFTSWRRVVLETTALPELESRRPVQERSRSIPEPQEPQVETAPVEPAGAETYAAPAPADTLPGQESPPIPSGNKTADAKNWVRWMWSRGDQPLLTHVNRQVGSDSLVKRRDLTDWRSEWEQEQSTEQEPARLRAVGE